MARTSEFDDPRVQAAMRAFLLSVDRLAEASSDDETERSIIDVAEAKSLAEMALRRRLQAAGWRPPEPSAASEVRPAAPTVERHGG